MKNWTLRQRILASFAVIIAIMLLMVVVSYSRLLKIEASENSVRDDAIPGVYYSSMIRGAFAAVICKHRNCWGSRKGRASAVKMRPITRLSNPGFRNRWPITVARW